MPAFLTPPPPSSTPLFPLSQSQPASSSRKRPSLVRSIVDHPKQKLAKPAQDELGKMIVENVICANQFPSLDQFFRHRQGRGSITNLNNVQHPAKHLLRHIGSRGAPVVIKTSPWPAHRTAAAVSRGPHKSALEYQEFLRTEMADMMKRAFWTVLPYSRVKHLKQLRVAPIGVVPQFDRRPRTIVDYSFSELNKDTLKLSPQEAMQFGRVLERIMTQVVHADPRYGPVKQLKVDMADGFCLIWVLAEDIPKLGVSFPALDGEEPLIAFPLSLPMGWTESPLRIFVPSQRLSRISPMNVSSSGDGRLAIRWKGLPAHHRQQLFRRSPTLFLCHPHQLRFPSLPSEIPYCRTAKGFWAASTFLWTISLEFPKAPPVVSIASVISSCRPSTMSSAPSIPRTPATANSLNLSKSCSRATQVGAPSRRSLVGYSIP
jgi:hypothetical protein